MVYWLMIGRVREASQSQSFREFTGSNVLVRITKMEHSPAGNDSTPK